MNLMACLEFWQRPVHAPRTLPLRAIVKDKTGTRRLDSFLVTEKDKTGIRRFDYFLVTGTTPLGSFLELRSHRV